MLAVVALQCAPEVRLDLSTVSAPRPVLEIVLKGFGVKFPEKSAWLKLQHQASLFSIASADVCLM